MPLEVMPRYLTSLVVAVPLLLSSCVSIYSDDTPKCRRDHELTSPASFSTDDDLDSLSVVVFDADKEQRLPGAWVRTETFERRTNEDGLIRFEKSTIDTVKVDYLGFQSQKLPLSSNTDSVVVRLSPCVARTG